VRDTARARLSRRTGRKHLRDELLRGWLTHGAEQLAAFEALHRQRARKERDSVGADIDTDLTTT
jgi:hypothetical protein